MIKKTIAILAAVLTLSACTRIETGEVGLRVDMSRQVQGEELHPGSWNQTVIGSVLEFPVRDIPIVIENKQPQTADNTTLSDFDMTIVYSITPSCVSQMWSEKSKSFHSNSEEGILLMYNFVGTSANNAAYKAVRKHRAIEVTDKRQVIEEEIRATTAEAFRGEKLENCLTVTTVQVRNMVPPQTILDSANAAVASQYALKVKENEVLIAEAEARRMKALSEDSGSSIAYMDAQARLNISEGVKQGKVQTIVVPADFKGIVSTAR